MIKALLLSFSFFVVSILHSQEFGLIPRPVSIMTSSGSFMIDENTALTFNSADKSLRAAADYFSSYINHISGIRLSQNTKTSKSIALKLAKTDEIGEEGYLLNVSISSITIIANTRKGVVYAMQTLFQALPAVRTNAVLQIPVMQVKDYPRFKWRGMLLDCSRHFFSPDFVREYIDLMALYKFNKFHWHLTDDQGWRIEIKKYPKLTQIGAWRVDETDKPWTQRPKATEDEVPSYGGYYTQEQIKEIVAYAALRNITIIPEIEMPGHSAAAIGAYPYLSCSQQPQLQMTGGNFTNISSNYCAGNDSVFTFLENVLDEVISLFPSQYIHVGGDEVDKTSWRKCLKCQARIVKEGIQNEEGLQSYFIRRIEKFLISKHRKMIGWDEILEGGLAPEATVMSWRGEQGGIAAAKMNHEVVMTPADPVYFDYYQGDPATEPLTIGGFNTLKKIYDYEPVPKELDLRQARYVLGAQGNLWGEYITTPAYVEYMVLPRMLALAEVTWSPKTSKDWNSFNERLAGHYKAFDQKGISYSKGNFKVEILPMVQKGKVYVSLSTETYNGEVHYTTDGTTPTLKSEKYSKPIEINTSLTLKAIVVLNGKCMSIVPTQQSFVIHKAVGKSVSYVNPVSRYYMADGTNSLTDGIRGTLAQGKHWHGFEKKDMIATVDLGEKMNIHSVSLGCLQRYRDWIMMPQWVKFEVSIDGVKFTELETVNNDVSVNELSPIEKDFIVEFPKRDVRFIRVTAKVLDALPDGHSGRGTPAWLFADEIIVN
jgi:hexosaminidase